MACRFAANLAGSSPSTKEFLWTFDVLAVCSGRTTAAERLGHREFAIHRRNPTI